MGLGAEWVPIFENQKKKKTKFKLKPYQNWDGL